MNKDTFSFSLISIYRKGEILMSATLAYYQHIINMYYKSAKQR